MGRRRADAFACTSAPCAPQRRRLSTPNHGRGGRQKRRALRQFGHRQQFGPRVDARRVRIVAEALNMREAIVTRIASTAFAVLLIASLMGCETAVSDDGNDDVLAQRDWVAET